jgi:homoprotocatechuate degradation regulator HpaR
MHAREHAMTPIREMLAETGLTEQQWRVLRVLSQYGPQDVTAISERACLLLPSLTRILRTMDAKGLTQRMTDPEDRRRQRVEITEAGQGVLDQYKDHSMRIVQGFRDQLGDQKYEQLLDLLNAFSHSVEGDA